MMNAWIDLDDLLGAAAGDYSACVLDLGGHTHYAYRADEVYPAASLIKIAIALTIDAAIVAGRLDPSATLTFQEEMRVEGEGQIDQAAAGSVWSYDALLYAMLHESDNTASNLLIGWLEAEDGGMAAVSALATALGAPQTRLQRRFMDYAAARAGRDNETTAADMTRLLWHLALATQPSTQTLLAALHDSVVPLKLVAGLPLGTPVAHKVGDVPGVEHDAGIVYGPRGVYIVALLARKIADVELAQATLATASRLIYQHMTEDRDGA